MNARTAPPILPHLVLGFALALFPAHAEPPASLAKEIAAIQSVGPEGAGNREAAAAFNSLSKAPVDAVLPILRAIESSSPLARNWLRSAVEVIVEREQAAGSPLPVDGLRSFLLDKSQAPEARRLAFDLMQAIDRESAAALIPGFLNDPSTELRRDAVAQLIAEAKSQAAEENKAAAVDTYRRALDAARDVDQIQEIAKELSESFEQKVDLPRHFGFLTDWQVIGPFHNTGRGGFSTEFPPEQEVDLKGRYPGKEGEVSWQALTSTDPYGKIDLNQPFGKLKEATAYAYHEFVAAQAGPAELRLGCKNAWKVWLNGKYLFGRDEYHRGQRIDQYKMPIQLEKGKNTILVKLCQNEQKENWTVEWEFQLRVCDSTGTAILSTTRPASPADSGN